MERLVPEILAAGFRQVEYSLENPEWAVSGREIELERRGSGVVDTITFNFDKYKRPRFQIHASRRLAEPPHELIHSGNLVARPSQYYHFWGKPWWLPHSLWSYRALESTVNRVSGHLPQLFRLLEQGKRGQNVSLETSRRGAI
jgi:hypothetical protein